MANAFLALRSSDRTTKTPGVIFARLLQLPTEPQDGIIGFCDAPTLYQLMHTSRHTLLEARGSKLFVVNPDAWYCVDANLISCDCHSADASYDMQFLPLVKQLGVQFRRMDAEYRLCDYCVTGEAVQDEEGLMSEEDDRATERLEVCLKDFWLRLHTQCPQVTRVVIQCSDFLCPPSVLPPEIFKKVAVIYNRSTEVILSLLGVTGRRDRRAQRRVWYRDPNNKTIISAIDWKETNSAPSANYVAEENVSGAYWRLRVI